MARKEGRKEEMEWILGDVMAEIDGGGKKGRASWELCFPWVGGE